MHLEYKANQLLNPHAPKYVEIDTFRRTFHSHPDLKDVAISDMKRMFGRCPICRWSLASRPPLLLQRDFLTWHFGRRGEKAIASAIRKGDPEEYVRQKADRKLHLVRMRVEKLNYYFEREVCPTHMAHRLPAHHLLHHLLHPRLHHHHLLCLRPRE